MRTRLGTRHPRRRQRPRFPIFFHASIPSVRQSVAWQSATIRTTSRGSSVIDMRPISASESVPDPTPTDRSHKKRPSQNWDPTRTTGKGLEAVCTPQVESFEELVECSVAAGKKYECAVLDERGRPVPLRGRYAGLWLPPECPRPARRPRQGARPGSRPTVHRGPSQLHPLQELGVHSHDHRARRHEHRAQRGRQQEAPCGEDASGQRDGNDIVSRCPPEVLEHLSVGAT